MSILEKQTKNILNDYIIKNIINNSPPSINNIYSKLTEIYRDPSLGKPFFKAILQKKYTESNPEELNEMIDNLLKDFDILFNEIIVEKSRMLSHMSEDIIKLNDIEKELISLENELSNIILVSNNSNLYNRSKNIDLTSLKDTDTELSTENMLDITTNTIHLPESNASKEKLDLSHLNDLDLPMSPESIVILNNVKDLSSMYNIQGSKFGNLFSDRYNQWKFLITTASPTELITQFGFNLNANNRLETISSIYIVPVVTVPVQIQIKYMASDNKYYNIPVSNNLKVLEHPELYTFTPIQAKRIRIIMSKKHYDSTTRTEGNDIRYQYEFGFLNISIFNNSYINEGTWFSSPLNILDILEKDNNINKVSIISEDNVPVNTKLNYYVKLDNSIKWQNISPLNYENPKYPKLIDFNNLSTNEQIIDNTSEGYGLNFYENQEGKIERKFGYNTINGISLYNIKTIKDDIVLNSVTLWRGIGCWRIITPDKKEMKTEFKSSIPTEGSRYYIDFDSSGLDIVPNSVRSVRFNNILKIDSINHLKEGIDDDYTVKYEKNKGTIYFNTNITSKIKDIVILFEYDYIDVQRYTKYTTSLYIESDMNILTNITKSNIGKDNFYIDLNDKRILFNIKINNQLPYNYLINKDGNNYLTFKKGIYNIEITPEFNSILTNKDEIHEFLNYVISENIRNSNIMRAFPYEMKMVSDYDLLNNVKINDNTKFSIIKRGNNHIILLNYWPSWKENGLDKDDKFILEYKYKNTNTSNKVLLKIEMESNSINISPIIKSLSIVGE